MARFSSRIAVAVVTAVAAVTIVVTTTAGADVHHQATAQSVGACSSADIVNWLNTTGNGTAGSIYYQVEFTNVSTQHCTLFGYPGVSAVNAAGHQIGATASRQSATPHTVNLAPGASATAAWQVTVTSNFTPSACKAQTAHGVRVYAPGATISDVIPFPYSTCSTHTVSLHVGPVRVS